MNYLDDLLEKLTNAVNIGYTGNAADIVARELHGYGIPAHIERDRSVVGHKKGTSDIGVMVACHLDEIGFVVSSIDEAGRLWLSTVGGVDVRTLPGQEVLVHGKEPLRGYIGAKPPHLTSPEERKMVQGLDKLFVDTGLDCKEVNRLVRVGDCISFHSTYQKLGHDMRSAKSLDNRASVACGMILMQELSQITTWCSVYFVATSQEEFTGLGARIHSYRLPVQYAVVVDVSFGNQPLVDEHEVFSLSKGPTVVRGGTVPEKLFCLLNTCAKENDITIQIEAIPSGTGTDAEAIAFNKEGIATCVVGIPLRYMHTPVEVVSLQDIECAKRLLLSYIMALETLDS